MTQSFSPLSVGAFGQRLNRMLYGECLISVVLGCSTSPCTPPPAPTSDGASAPNIAPPSPESTTATQPRARIDQDNWMYLVDFPTSISENTRRIAAMISIDGDLEGLFPQWVVIKDMATDKIMEELPIIDAKLSLKLHSTDHCRHNLSACMPEIQRYVSAANARFTTGGWRPFPCIDMYHSGRTERLGPGCELLAGLEVEYKDPLLIISRGERPVLTRPMPAWSPTYGKPQCKGYVDTYVESVALDPETGLFVVSLRFVGIGHGGGECAVTRWDFHPIRLPMFRREARQGRHDGAP